ncbi:hypothetical protein WMY93_019136 [Mugilogobius chulae]|uniref:Uncharacterized protein n=1 Tax=Mugilogobius chulae TaxID=88201 RepID=A0AAW0NEP8_9GOBI
MKDTLETLKTESGADIQQTEDSLRLKYECVPEEGLRRGKEHRGRSESTDRRLSDLQETSENLRTRLRHSGDDQSRHSANSLRLTGDVCKPEDTFRTLWGHFRCREEDIQQTLSDLQEAEDV